MSFRRGRIPNFLELAIHPDEKRAANNAEKGLTEEFLHAARAVGFNGFEFGIAEQIEVELLLSLECGLRFDGIAACAEDDDIKFVEVFLRVTKLGRFGGSTGSVGFGIEKEHDALAKKIGKRHVGAGIVLESECRSLVACFDHGKTSVDSNVAEKRLLCSRVEVQRTLQMKWSGKKPAENVVDGLRIGLTASGAHHLTDEEFEDTFVAGLELRDVIGIFGDYVAGGLLDGGIIDLGAEPFGGDDVGGRAARIKHGGEDFLGDGGGELAGIDELEKFGERSGRDRAGSDFLSGIVQAAKQLGLNPVRGGFCGSTGLGGGLEIIGK